MEDQKHSESAAVTSQAGQGISNERLQQATSDETLDEVEETTLVPGSRTGLEEASSAANPSPDAGSTAQERPSDSQAGEPM